MPNEVANTELSLLALMVARQLKTEHGIDEAPHVADYEIQMASVRPNGSTDVRVEIPLARGIAIDVKQHWWVNDGKDLTELVEAATEIAAKVASVNDVREEIVDMTRSVRAAASREIARARRRGLRYRLVSCKPETVYSTVDEGVSVRVVCEHLSEYLRPEQVEFMAGCVDDVIREFEANREEQAKRTIRRYHLDEVGGTGELTAS
ncbi:hypothetical protein [Sphingomonas sp. UYEF23]|uniref:hypothetical protein n=1 Tax=Sphingomonas sp. UYEF23 TaxID=1756408 RepID=UPI003397A118